MSEHKIFNYPSEILIEATVEKYGYHPDKFGPSSAKFVLATCRYCGQPSEIRKCFFKKSGSACHKACRLKEQGSFSPFKSNAVQQKIKQTNIEKYGVEHPAQNSEIAKKIVKSKQSKKLNIPKIRGLKESDSLKLLHKYIDRSNIERIQNEIKSAIEKLNIQVELVNDRVIVDSKKFEISVNHNYYNSELSLGKGDISRLKHYNMTEECRNKGVRLFHIFEGYWDVRKSQMMNFIKTILGANSIKVNARECEITNEPDDQFINRYHIQGFGAGTLRFFNLEYDGRIVTSMTAGRHHRQGFKDVIVLNRLCFLDGVNVRGGASKLFKAFIAWAKENSYNKLISWSDNSWTDGGIYKVLGFKLESTYAPDYFYWDYVHNKYLSKQSQKKNSVGCPSEITEREWCFDRGLYRIYDCGKTLWSYSLI